MNRMTKLAVLGLVAVLSICGDARTQESEPQPGSTRLRAVVAVEKLEVGPSIALSRGDTLSVLVGKDGSIKAEFDGELFGIDDASVALEAKDGCIGLSVGKGLSTGALKAHGRGESSGASVEFEVEASISANLCVGVVNGAAILLVPDDPQYQTMVVRPGLVGAMTKKGRPKWEVKPGLDGTATVDFPDDSTSSSPLVLDSYCINPTKHTPEPTTKFHFGGLAPASISEVFYRYGWRCSKGFTPIVLGDLGTSHLQDAVWLAAEQESLRGVTLDDCLYAFRARPTSREFKALAGDFDERVMMVPAVSRFAEFEFRNGVHVRLLGGTALQLDDYVLEQAEDPFFQELQSEGDDTRMSLLLGEPELFLKQLVSPPPHGDYQGSSTELTARLSPRLLMEVDDAAFLNLARVVVTASDIQHVFTDKGLDVRINLAELRSWIGEPAAAQEVESLSLYLGRRLTAAEIKRSATSSVVTASTVMTNDTEVEWALRFE